MEVSLWDNDDTEHVQIMIIIFYLGCNVHISHLRLSRPSPFELFVCLQAVITQRVVDGLYSGISTTELDTLAAETAAALTVRHPDYAILAARIAVTNLHKETRDSFSGL